MTGCIGILSCFVKYNRRGNDRCIITEVNPLISYLIAMLGQTSSLSEVPQLVNISLEMNGSVRTRLGQLIDSIIDDVIIL